MKRKLYTALLLCGMLTMAGCGKTQTDLESAQDATDIPAVTKEAEIKEEVKETTTPTPEEAADSADVFPDASGITEVSMGIAEDMCKFKVPVNYILVGGSYDAEGNESPIKGLDSSTTTVQEALDAGSFSTGQELSAFTLTNADGSTMVTASLMTSSLMSWDDYETTYADAKQIGTDSVPALVYHVDAFSGKSLTIAVRINEDVTLQVIYEGNLEDTLGEDGLAQALYDLVTVL